MEVIKVVDKTKRRLIRVYAYRLHLHPDLNLALIPNIGIQHSFVVTEVDTGLRFSAPSFYRNEAISLAMRLIRRKGVEKIKKGVEDALAEYGKAN